MENKMENEQQVGMEKRTKEKMEKKQRREKSKENGGKIYGKNNESAWQKRKESQRAGEKTVGEAERARANERQTVRSNYNEPSIFMGRWRGATLLCGWSLAIAGTQYTCHLAACRTATYVRPMSSPIISMAIASTLNAGLHTLNSDGNERTSLRAVFFARERMEKESFWNTFHYCSLIFTFEKVSFWNAFLHCSLIFTLVIDTDMDREHRTQSNNMRTSHLVTLPERIYV